MMNRVLVSWPPMGRKVGQLTVSSSEWLPFPLPKVCSTPAKLNSVRCINDSLTEIELRLAPSSLFECLPGQFVDVSLTREVKRSYSIYRFNPVSRTISFLIKILPNGVASSLILNSLKVNDLLFLEGPKGSFSSKLRKKLDKNKRMNLFVATGSGIAPIYNMITDDEELSEDANHLIWGNRSDQEIANLEELLRALTL